MTTTSSESEIQAWFTGRLPQAWTASGQPDVVVDREEITVVLALAEPQLAEGASEAERAEALAGRVQGWREETREHRMAIAREAEHRFDRKVAWAVRAGGRTQLFTHLAVPVMTRLRQPERRVLDTLVQAGVARSRAHALAWCVRLVGENTQEWLGRLREAMEQVDEVRRQGPGGAQSPAPPYTASDTPT